MVFEGELEHLKVRFQTFNSQQVQQYFYLLAMNYSIFPFYNGVWNQPSFPAINYYNIDSNYLNSFPTYHYVIQEQDYHLLNTNFNNPHSHILRYEQTNPNTQSLHPQTSINAKRKNPIKPLTSSNTTKYGKKNAESNVVNQVFSFLSIRSKSKKILSIILQNRQQLIDIYYQVIKHLKRRNRKYINRYYLKQLIQMPENHLASLFLKKADVYQKLGIDLFRKTIRVLINYYLENVSIAAILTSSKLDKQTKYEHLQRKKEIQMYLRYHMKISNNTRSIQQ